MRDKPEIFMAPGPTPVPYEVLLAQGSPLVYHRGPGYGQLLREVTESLQELMKTTSDVLVLTSSGTGGLESAVTNLCSPGDRVVVPIAGDAWGVDVAVGGSQKALSAAPGVAFVSVSQKAWEATKTATCPRFYFDWVAYRDSYDRKDPENPYTPAISTMQGLREALRLYFAEGQDAVLERHRTLSEATKAGVLALGLELSGEYVERAWAVTAVKAPAGM